MRTFMMLVATILIMGLGYCGEVKADLLKEFVGTYAVDPSIICRLQQGASS